jgi:hypothetical protein
MKASITGLQGVTTVRGAGQGRAFLAECLLFSFYLLVPAGAFCATTPASIVLTAQDNGVVSQHDFVCYGKIHGYIRLPERASGEHILESRWHSPAGKIAADSRSTVDFRPGRSTAYVWFSFPERSRLPGMPDPDLEQELLTYSGNWRVDVLWDEKPLIQSDFKVRCP